MDKTLIRQRFARAASTYSVEATAQQRIALHLADIISQHVPAPWHNRVWEVGCGTGLFTRAYLQNHTPTEMWLNDICPEMEQRVSPLLSPQIHFVAGDAEQALPPHDLSLISSCSVLQWFAHPLDFFQRCHHALVPGGYMGIATFGENNFQEIRRTTGTGLCYHSASWWQTHLQSMGFQVIIAQDHDITLWFSSPLDVLRHLKQTGVTGIQRQTWTREKLSSFSRDYSQRFASPEGKVPLTYNPIYLILKKI